MLTLSPLRSAAVYYGLSLVLVTALVLAGAGTAAAMVVPLVSVVLMLLVVTREGWSRSGWAGLGLHRAGLRGWPLALVAPVAILTVGGVATVLLGVAEWDPVGNAAMLPPVLYPAVLLLNIAVASLSVSLTEEVGWRGYLLPRLTGLGERRALLLSGLLHGVWHLPVVLLSDLYLTDGSPFVTVPVFLVTATAFGVVAGWLRLTTGSLWPAVLVHAAHNVAIMWFVDSLEGDPVVMERVAGESGAITVCAYVGLAAVLLARSRRGPGVSVPRPAASERLTVLS